jgi:hypothetical protein
VDGTACVIAAMRPAPDSATFAEHERDLRAAEVAGSTHVLQIAAVSAPGGGDQFLYHATETEAAVAAAQVAGTGQALHMNP